MSGDLSTAHLRTVAPSTVGLACLTDPADAATLGNAVLEGLRVADVRLDLRRVDGVTTAFATAFLLILVAEYPLSILRSRLQFVTSNDTQRDVLRRSLGAIDRPTT